MLHGVSCCGNKVTNEIMALIGGYVIARQCDFMNVSFTI